MKSEAPLRRAESHSDTDAGAGLYIHVPFCASVCPYCDFAVTIAGDDRREAWVDGVVREAAMYTNLGLEFDTLYFGGGTPSALGPELIGRIIDGLRGHLSIGAGAAQFLEANPEDVNVETARAWRDLGFDFVSLGAQSFDDADLAFLGRRHGGSEAQRAAEILSDGSFDTFSLDLIYGLEGRSANHWRRQLESALALGVDHLSCYQLTIHEGTLLGRRAASGAVAQLDERECSDLFYLTHELLADAGFEGYEVSNFASSDRHRSIHNQKYWDHTPYLGLGPSAHSFVGGRRWWNRRKLRRWQSAVDLGEAPVEDVERPSTGQLILEALMLGFRTADGVDLGRLKERYGVDLLARNAAVVDRFVASHHLEVVGERLLPTLAGLAIADTLARSFDVQDIRRDETEDR
jgi:oxygen-independent coproporphyrinogen-3 oxidase